MVNSVTSACEVHVQIKDVLVDKLGKNFTLSEFAVLARICRAWHVVIQPSLEEKLLQEVSFNKDSWLSIPGVDHISEDHELTAEQKKWIVKQLKNPCKFFNDSDPIQPHKFQNKKIKKTWQTHKLIFYPQKINKEDRTINSQNKLFHFIKKVDDGNAFDFIVGMEEDAFRNQAASHSYWALAMLDIAPNSLSRSYEKKEALLKCKGYRVSTPTEATTTNLILNHIQEEDDDYSKVYCSTVTAELYEDNRLVIGNDVSGAKLYTTDEEHLHLNSVIGATGILEVPKDI